MIISIQAEKAFDVEFLCLRNVSFCELSFLYIPGPSFVGDARLSPICIFDFFAKYQMTIVLWNSWMFYFVTLIYLYVFVEVSFCFYWHSCVLYLGIWYGNPSNNFFLLPTHYCCCYPESYFVTYEFYDCFVYFFEECHDNFHQD